MLLYIHHILFTKFHMAFTLQPPKVWWQTSVKTWKAQFDFPSFWIALKQIFLWEYNNFCYKPIPNNSHLQKKILKKILFFFFPKNSPYLFYNSHIYICIHIYANKLCFIFFARTPSMIQWIVRQFEAVEWFLWKPFWFFQRIFSILGQIQLRNIAL